MPVDHSQIRQFGNLEFLAKQAVEGFITGLHKSPYHGFSVEFAEHKLYNTGESTRHIDWKVYARTDRLYTKRYEEETNLRCQILIDVSSSMYYPDGSNNKLNFAINSAAALAYMLQKQRDAVGITLFSDQIEYASAVKSTSSHLNTLFLELEKLQNTKPEMKKTSVAPTIHEIADKIPRRSLIIIFSDMFDNVNSSEELFPALQHLKHNKHEVLLFHTIDKKTEEDFEFSNRPYVFIDMESGEKIKLSPNEIKDHYVKGIKEYNKELKLKCGQYKIDFIEADINQGVESILLPYLVKRSKMK